MINADRIVTAYGDMLYKISIVLLCNPYDAEDATEDTFLKYIEKSPTFANSQHEKAWLIRVCTNICKNMLRFRKSHLHLDIDDLAEQLSIPQNSDFEALQLVMSLPLKYKTAVHLYYFEGYKVKEIAEIMSISESAVKKRLEYSRKALKLTLEDERKDFYGEK